MDTPGENLVNRLNSINVCWVTKMIKVDSRLTSERTYGGEGRRYAGSSGDRGREVEMSIRVVASLNVREIVTASRGLSVHAKG